MVLGTTFLYTLMSCLVSRDGICYTDDCIKTADMLTGNMLGTVPAYKPNACDNFYEYACGRFRYVTTIPAGQNGVRLTDTPKSEMDALIGDLLIQPNRYYDSHSLERVRQAYQDCILRSRSSAPVPNCVRRMKQQYPRAVVYLLVDALNLYEARNRVQIMLQQLKESFVKIIENSWLDETGSEEAIRKIRSVQGLVFFTDNMINPGLLDQPDLKRPINVLEDAVKYDYDNHCIGVPIMAVQIPFYNYGLQSMDAGGLGFAMARELAHILDPIGVTVDSTNQKSDWWTPYMQREYSSRARRFVDQYSQFKDNGIQINAASTVNENIKDNVGFEIAFNAYHAYAGRQKKLRGFETFTPEQLFTLAFASLHCERLTILGTQEVITYQPHAPASTRVNGVAMNSLKFSAIWNCPQNSAMNISVKNNMWALGIHPDNVFLGSP